MLEVNVIELCGFSTFSQDKSWSILLDRLNEKCVGCNDITLDFKDVTLVKPWSHDTFNKLLCDDRIVLMRFYDYKDINNLAIACKLSGQNTTKVMSVESEVTPVKSRAEILGDMIKNMAVIDGDSAYIDMSIKYTQMSNVITNDYISEALNLLYGQGIKNVVLDFSKVKVSKDLVGGIAEYMVVNNNRGMVVSVEFNDETLFKELSLHINKFRKPDLDIEKRRLILKNELNSGDVGLLIKYKSSKAIDSLGRHGNGEIISNRVAIFRGWNGDNMLFEVYSNNSFYTKLHWYSEHDGETLDKLEKSIQEIKLKELGFKDEFLGSDYHFIEPIQRSSSEYTNVILGTDENNNMIKKNCTLPEMIELIFNDWGVAYNKDKLKKSIEDTKDILNK